MSDQLVCTQCSLAWDVNDQHPPKCKTSSLCVQFTGKEMRPMKELTKEIELTISMMQGDVDDGAHDELQSHLYSLLEMKRELLKQNLTKLGETHETSKPRNI